MMDARENWHPLGLSDAVEAGSAAGTRLFGKELVIWRDARGVAHVWEDRCPHRGMKLSFGFVRGDHITCLYHGWRYGASGACRFIPAHPDLAVPPSIKVAVYPSQESGGMVWTSLTDHPPPLAQDREPSVPLRSLYLACDTDTAIAALSMVRLTAFASQGLADTVVRRVTDTLYEVSSGPDRLLIGIQAISDVRTALHLVICGSPKLYQGAGQRHFLAWAMRLRDIIEHPRRPASAAHALSESV